MTTIEPSRRERKKEETRHRIFHAAIDLFRERGFEQTTVDDITERADVAKGTFFNYYPRKDAVLGFLSENRLLAMEENFEAIFAEDHPAGDKLVDLYSRAATAYEADRDLSRYVLVESMNRAFAPHEDSGMRWHELIRRLLEQGQQKGEIRVGIDLVRAEGVLTAVYYATLYEWVCCTPEPYAMVAEVRARLALALEGIAS